MLPRFWFHRYALKKIPNILAFEIERLKENKVRTTIDLLERTCNFKGREALSTLTGISKGRLLYFANCCDFLRIPTLGTVYIMLLKEAEVATIRALKARNPRVLHKTLVEVARANPNICKFPPDTALVDKWVTVAKRLDIVISY